MDYIFYTLFTIVTLIATISVYYMVKFGLLILKLQDDIEYALDVLDESFNTFNTILEKPVFFDSVEVRQCINEIKKTRASVINIASTLSNFGKSKVESKNLLEVDTGGKESERKKEDSQF